jgi:hypothetical protein
MHIDLAPAHKLPAGLFSADGDLTYQRPVPFRQKQYAEKALQDSTNAVREAASGFFGPKSGPQNDKG